MCFLQPSFSCFSGHPWRATKMLAEFRDFLQIRLAFEEDNTQSFNVQNFRDNLISQKMKHLEKIPKIGTYENVHSSCHYFNHFLITCPYSNSAPAWKSIPSTMTRSKAPRSASARNFAPSAKRTRARGSVKLRLCISARCSIASATSSSSISTCG